MRSPFLHTLVIAILLYLSSSFVYALPHPKPALEEVVVVASRVEMPLRTIGSSVSVITQEQIKLQGHTQLTDVLRTQPGVGVSNSGGAGKVSAVRIRGEEGYRTLILIDGVEASDPSAPQVAALPHLLSSSNSIERIEILRGPQGFIYGADAGGVVNIISKSPQDGIVGQLSSEFGRYDSRAIDAYIAGGFDAGDFFVSVSDQKTNGFNSRVSDESAERDGNKNTTLHAKLGYNLFENGNIKLVLRDIDAVSEFDGCGFPSSNNCLADSQQTIAKLSFDIESTHVNHYAAISHTDVERLSIADGGAPFISEGSIKKYEYFAGISLNAKTNLTLGADYKQEGVGVTDVIERTQKSAFFEVQNTSTENLTLTAGARIDDNDDFGTHTSIRLTSAYIIDFQNDHTVKFRASAGTGFRAPSISEIAYNQGPFAFGEAQNFALNEETSRGIDLGVDFYWGEKFNVEFTYFNQEIEDEIFFDLVQFQGYLQDDGATKSRGFEVASKFYIASASHIFANYTYNKTKNLEGITRIRRPERSANFGLSHTALNDKLTLLISIRSIRDAQDQIFGVGRVPLDNYKVIDISANYALNKQLEIYGRIANAADENYQEITGFNTAGASFYSGFRFSF